MKKILLPTDFSNNAWNAIFTALKLYAEVECQFYILNAYEPNAMNMLGRIGQQRLGTIYDSLSTYSIQELEKVLTYLRKNHNNPKHSFETISKSDTLEETVDQLIIEKQIDLICMGTKGASGAKQVFMGSNTVKMLKKINNCPILVVPVDYDFQSLKALAFPTDFSKRCNKHVIAPMTEIALLWKPSIQIIHVTLEFSLNEQQKINQKILKEYFSELDVTVEHIDFKNNIAHTLEKFIDTNNVDLMVLIRHHHTFWQKLIGEPVVKKMTFHTHIPLLVLPE